MLGLRPKREMTIHNRTSTGGGNSSKWRFPPISAVPFCGDGDGIGHQAKHVGTAGSSRYTASYYSRKAKNVEIELR